MNLSTNYRNQAMRHPAALYDHPKEVLEDTRLTDLQRAAILQNWADDVRQRLAASAENMPRLGGKHPDDALLLQRIVACRGKLSV